jgi:hypothetical protein
MASVACSMSENQTKEMKRKANNTVARNVRYPDQLPNELIIHNGRVVDGKTKLPPEFPADLNGMAVNVVPHDDLVKIMRRRDQLLKAVAIISRVIDSTKTKP